MSLLRGRNAVVTGATRGIGRGLALGLAELGANVYITGRTASGPDSLQHVADLVRKAGGNCECFVVDHSQDDQVANMFEQLKEKLDADGATLDLFVNNAYSAVGFVKDSMDVPFWNKSVHNPATPQEEADPGKVWDLVNGVGLRNNYVCAARALRIMDKQKSGIIVNITSWATLMNLFDVAYAVGKESVDRLTAEIAHAAPEGVTCFSLCPGFVATTELLEEAMRRRDVLRDEGLDPDKGSLPIWNAETPLFVGRVLAALVSERGANMLPGMAGRVVVAAEVGERLDVKDEKDFRCLSSRSLRFQAILRLPLPRESPFWNVIPRSLYAPWTFLRWFTGAHKFWN